MQLDGLRALYRSIKENNKTYTIFNFTKNKVEFDVFYDIGCTPNKLGFILLKSNFNLWIPVTKGFIIDHTIDRETYSKLCKILNLNYDPNNRFSPFSFFKEFNNTIPQTYIIPKESILNDIVSSHHNIEEPNKLYYFGHKKLPKGHKRSLQNSEKTRLLYPEIYESIKNDTSISIAYTATLKN